MARFETRMQEIGGPWQDARQSRGGPLDAGHGLGQDSAAGALSRRRGRRF
jgi:hypothetical protein